MKVAISREAAVTSSFPVPSRQSVPQSHVRVYRDTQHQSSYRHGKAARRPIALALAVVFLIGSVRVRLQNANEAPDLARTKKRKT
jgi:hypothetical protein